MTSVTCSSATTERRAIDDQRYVSSATPEESCNEASTSLDLAPSPRRLGVNEDGKL